MSQSGIPVVSQVAGALGNVVAGVGDIVSGKNVFESLGRIIVAPVAGALDLANDLSFNTLANAPVVGDVFEGGKGLYDNPYDADAATKLGRGIATTAAVTAGGAAGLGLAYGEGATALLSAGELQGLGGVSLAAGSAANRNLAGVVGGLAQIGSSVGINTPEVPGELKSAYNAVKPLAIGSLASPPPVYTNNSVNAATQTALLGVEPNTILIFGAIGALLYILYRS